MLIDPKEIKINYEGEELKFNIGKFPATTGRELIAKYPIANIPNIGSYEVSKEAMLKLMQYVERVYDDRVQPLSNEALVNNHVPSWEVLLELEMQTISYNCSFFNNGKAIEFVNNIGKFLKENINPELKKILPEVVSMLDNIQSINGTKQKLKGVQ